MLLVSFDLYIIRSWDGDAITWQGETVGPDLWRFGVGNDTVLVTTFSNWSVGHQSYPSAFPTGEMPAFTGASEINALGYEYSGNLMDAVYHLSFLIPDQGDELELDFSALGLQFLADESWGLDNVEVRIIDFDNHTQSTQIRVPTPHLHKILERTKNPVSPVPSGHIRSCVDARPRIARASRSSPSRPSRTGAAAACPPCRGPQSRPRSGNRAYAPPSASADRPRPRFAHAPCW